MLFSLCVKRAKVLVLLQTGPDEKLCKEVTGEVDVGRLLVAVTWWAMQLDTPISIVTPKEIAAGRNNVGIDRESTVPTLTCNLRLY